MSHVTIPESDPFDPLTHDPLTHCLLCICVQNIVNNHDENEAGHAVIVTALERMLDVVEHINELQRQHERLVRTHELRGSLASGGGVDIIGFGELILEASRSLIPLRRCDHQ